MERTANDLSMGSDNTQTSTASSQPGEHGTGASGDQGVMDRARDLTGTAQSKLADVGSTIREKTGSAKDSLADALESGAERLRQRTHESAGGLAGSTSAGSVEVSGDGRMVQLSDRLASGMDATANFLREADLDGLRSGIERQVREHPGRTLLVAAGLGYLIGRAFRRDR